MKGVVIWRRRIVVPFSVLCIFSFSFFFFRIAFLGSVHVFIFVRLGAILSQLAVGCRMFACEYLALHRC